MNFPLIACVGIPFIGAGFLKWTKSKTATSRLCWLVTTIVLGFSIYIFFKTWMDWPDNLVSFGLRSDMLGATFNLLSAFAWWLVSWYLPGYLKEEANSKNFYLFFLLTLAAVQGIFLASNWISLLAFFEIMTITSFFWVIHNQEQESISAGYFYLFLGVAAGLLIAAGLVFLNTLGLSLEFGSNQISLTSISQFYWAIAFLVTGFGIKAGMVPLHIWLPKAHTVAPTPGSALLSGIIIKCGIYGLLRTTQLINYIGLASNIGLVVIILGIITMLLGVSLALLQSNAKRLLAYHSISQIGYIILGIGTAIYLGSNGGSGLAGAIYHTINHAIFKAALFLGVGIIYLRTKELNLYKMGGLWRQFPVTAVLMLIAVFGITGTPGFNGYISKTILHSGISEAAQADSSLLIWVERLFNLVGIGTAASFAKLYYLAFLKRPHPNLRITGKENSFLVVPIAVLSLIIIIFGIKPQLFIEGILPTIFSDFAVTNPALLTNISFWSGTNLLSMGVTLLLGIGGCAIAFKTGLFHWNPPAWLSIEYLGRKFVNTLAYLGAKIEQSYEQITAFLKNQLSLSYSWLLNFTTLLDSSGWGSSGKISFSNINFDMYLILIAFAIMLIYILF